MCGRYGFSIKDAREVINRFDLINTLDEVEKLESRYNIAPGQMNPVIVQTSQGNKMGRFFWGLIPSWSKEDSFKFKTINARAEGIEHRPVYKKPFRSQRCLIPATNFYEWDKSQIPSQPYNIQFKDGTIFAFAGLYDIWHDKENEKELYSYTIITTEPNKLIEKIHNRMPVILKKEHEKEWLNPDYTEPEQLHKFLIPYNEHQMEMYPISRLVNIPTKDDKQIIKPTA